MLTFELRARPVRDALVTVVAVARPLGSPLAARRGARVPRQACLAEPPPKSLPLGEHRAPSVAVATNPCPMRRAVECGFVSLRTGVTGRRRFDGPVELEEP
jgi:hypothetical protein